VAQALFDLEATNSELKADLRDLYITGAKEIDVQAGSRKAIIVHVRARAGLGWGRGLAAPAPAAGARWRSTRPWQRRWQRQRQRL
jgi:hypothetical protein